VLPDTVTRQGFKVVARRRPQKFQRGGCGQLGQLALSHVLNVGKTPGLAGLVKRLRFTTLERLDHGMSFYNAYRIPVSGKSVFSIW
jgi:hypothetical protein